MSKPVIKIHGQRVTSLETFYDEVSASLIPSASWGRNLDAFNDILRGGFGTPDGGFTLVWDSSEHSRQNLGYPETIRYLTRKLERCHSTGREKVRAELLTAQALQGQTLFDLLVEIIQGHEEIELQLR